MTQHSLASERGVDVLITVLRSRRYESGGAEGRVVSIDANVRTCLFGRERELGSDAGRNVPEASERGVVARAMALVIPTRRVALIHDVKFRVVGEQAFALAVIAVRAVEPFVVRFADTRFDRLDPVNFPKTMTRGTFF